jgi:hypothetical protein
MDEVNPSHLKGKANSSAVDSDIIKILYGML